MSRIRIDKTVAEDVRARWSISRRVWRWKIRVMIRYIDCIGHGEGGGRDRWRLRRTRVVISGELMTYVVAE